MVAALLGGVLGALFLGNEASEDGGAALELAAVVFGINPVGDLLRLVLVSIELCLDVLAGAAFSPFWAAARC